ncbi:MAG: hypothetical protein JWO56_3145 [Acidobacteria bacterium]|nr:hypothetical protein [Acidobacteriota bacterium]
MRLVRATDGSAPRLSTSVAAYRDDEALTFVFSAADDLVVARYRGHDEPLWEHDVVEVFLAPERRTEYFELEVNPLGTTFDARIESPDGQRGTMRTFLDWTCQGLFAAVRKDVESGGAMTIETVIRIPFASLGGAPAPGTEWAANLFRVDRHPDRGDEYTAWQPTGKVPADFHVPAAFGLLRFD